MWDVLHDKEDATGSMLSQVGRDPAHQKPTTHLQADCSTIPDQAPTGDPCAGPIQAPCVTPETQTNIMAALWVTVGAAGPALLAQSLSNRA